MAQPAVAHALPVRAWRVDLDTSLAYWSCALPGCPGVAVRGRGATQVALDHLAGHAADERLAPHLRTCRCHMHGCTWHPRHRGCDGPVSMVVFRSSHSATWQLADACAACARAIPLAAQLPLVDEPPLRGRRTTPVVPVPDTRSAEGLGSNGLASLVTYLDAALAPETEPVVRVFALVCLLRADCGGSVRLPWGLLRGWRLADCRDEAVADLTRQRWLCEQPPHVGCAHTVRIGDSTGTAVLRATSRRHRRQLLDQASRLLRQPHLRGRAHADRLGALLTPLSRGSSCSGRPRFAGSSPLYREVSK